MLVIWYLQICEAVRHIAVRLPTFNLKGKCFILSQKNRFFSNKFNVFSFLSTGLCWWKRLVYWKYLSFLYLFLKQQIKPDSILINLWSPNTFKTRKLASINQSGLTLIKNKIGWVTQPWVNQKQNRLRCWVGILVLSCFQ